MCRQEGYNWRRYRQGAFQGPPSPEENLAGMENEQAMF